MLNVYQIRLYSGIFKGERISYKGWSEKKWFARSQKVYRKRNAYLLLQVKSFCLSTGNHSNIYGNEFLQIILACTPLYLASAIDHIFCLKLPPTWLLKNVEIWWRSWVGFLNYTWKLCFRLIRLNIATKLSIIVG